MGKIDNRYARCIGIECTTTTGKTCLGSKEIIHHCPNMHSGVNLTCKMLLQVACVETCRENIFISIQITGIACCQYMILPFWFESKSCSYYIHLMLQSQVKPVHITWRYPCRLCKCKQKWKVKRPELILCQKEVKMVKGQVKPHPEAITTTMTTLSIPIPQPLISRSTKTMEK